MTFWLVIGLIVAALLLVAWLYDRRRGFQGDISARAHGWGVAQGKVADFHAPNTGAPPNSAQ